MDKVISTGDCKALFNHGVAFTCRSGWPSWGRKTKRLRESEGGARDAGILMAPALAKGVAHEPPERRKRPNQKLRPAWVTASKCMSVPQGISLNILIPSQLKGVRQKSVLWWPLPVTKKKNMDAYPLSLLWLCTVFPNLWEANRRRVGM